jgi:hypothetical protein
MRTITIVDFLNARLAEAKILTGDAGFLESPFFQMVLAGNAKLPLHRVGEVADFLGCDRGMLFRLAMRQFYTDAAISTFEEMLVYDTSENERTWLNEIRAAANGEVPMPSANARRLVRALVSGSDQPSI